MLRRRTAQAGALARVGALALGLGACAPPIALEPVPPCDELELERASRDANLVLVVNDTMRRDALGLYGGPADTPVFDRFAREHLYFERATSEAPWTRPAVATLFTSLYPSQHGLAGVKPLSTAEARRGLAHKKIDTLGAGFFTLAEVLQQAGLRTAAFSANMWFDRAFGFSQGFDTYDGSSASWGLPGAELNRKVHTWLAQVAPDQRFFLYVHYMDSHEPYGALHPDDLAGEAETSSAEAPLAPAYADLMGKMILLEDGRTLAEAGVPATQSLILLAYRRGIEDFDRVLGELLQLLLGRDDWERTAVVVTSDHGEALFERGYRGHGNSPFEDETAVPLAARLPGVRGKSARVTCPVGLIDLMPTLCDYLGLRCPAGTQGVSYLSLASAEREATPRFLISEGVRGHPLHRAVRGRRYKLVHQPDGQPGPEKRSARSAYSLYDLTADPQERRDLMQSEPRPGDEAVTALARTLRGAVPEALPPARRYEEVSPETLEHLRALGYAESEAAQP